MTSLESTLSPSPSFPISAGDHHWLAGGRARFSGPGMAAIIRCNTHCRANKKEQGHVPLPSLPPASAISLCTVSQSQRRALHGRLF